MDIGKQRKRAHGVLEGKWRLLWVFIFAFVVSVSTWVLVGDFGIVDRHSGAQHGQILLWGSLQASQRNASEILLWPAPASSRNGWNLTTLSNKFSFSASHKLDILERAFSRYHKIIFKHHKIHSRKASDKTQGFVLDRLEIELLSVDETLQLGVNEFYHLQVPDPSNPKVASLRAATVYGALRGLETFSQLCTFNFTTRTIQLQNCPWDIADQPRFPYRGLLIDTSRHYQPLETIKNVIDSMAYAKLNVLHWHIVDEQSFPIEIPSYPKLWDGAYTNKERYTIDDAKSIVEYARLQGVNVMAEIDVPGHARSWGIGYPELWPSANCSMPLDVSKEFTFELIEGLLSDLSKVFPFRLFHLGGDEVDTSCWQLTQHVNQWLQERNLTVTGGYEYFVLRAQKLALKYGYIPVQWQETFKNFGSTLHRESIVHSWYENAVMRHLNWWGLEVAPEVVKAGLRCIVSEQSSWYLDHLHIPWEKFYMNEPLNNITDADEQKLIVGGQVCMWGETIDASDIQQTIWPRAAAAAERLWSPREITDEGPESAVKRLEVFRCLLTERGIAAAPVHVQGRAAPLYPGSCYQQR